MHLTLTGLCMRCWFLAALSNSHKLLLDVETPVEQCAACEFHLIPQCLLDYLIIRTIRSTSTSSHYFQTSSGAARICSLLFQCSSQLFTIFVLHVGYGSYRPGERWILARLFAHMNTCGRRTTWADGSPTGDLDILSVRPSIDCIDSCCFHVFWYILMYHWNHWIMWEIVRDLQE